MDSVAADTLLFQGTAADTLLIANPEMHGQVFGLVRLWLGFVALVFAILFVRYTLGVGFSERSCNPYNRETLAMPRGTLRGLLTLSLLFAVLLLEVLSLNGKVKTVGGSLVVPEDMYKGLMVAFQMMLAFYFGGKVLDHVTTEDTKKTTQLLKTIKAKPAKTGEFDEPGAVG